MLNTEGNRQFINDIEDNIQTNIKILKIQIKQFDQICDKGKLQDLAYKRILINMLREQEYNFTNFVKNCPFY